MDDKLKTTLYFIRRCNFILNRYMVFTLLDAMIIGAINAIAMLVLRMPYVGLISAIVAITNLIPTFGPVIGAVIGGFLLLLIAIVTMGNAFGIGGILLAIPVAAIFDFSYREGLLPYLQKRKAEKQAALDAKK